MRIRQTIATLNPLIESALASEAMCRTCASVASGAGVRESLNERAEEWSRIGEELQALVLMLGGSPARRETAATRNARQWSAIKARIFGADDTIALQSVQHAELDTLHRYGRALGGYLPERIRRTVALHANRLAERTDAIDHLWERCGVPFAEARKRVKPTAGEKTTR